MSDVIGCPLAAGQGAVVSDMKAFRRARYVAERRTGGELTEFRISDEPTPSFHQGIIVYADRTVAVVCVRDSSLLAVAVPRVIAFAPARESSPLTFVDLPDLASALAQAAGFRLLTANELNGPIDPGKVATNQPTRPALLATPDAGRSPLELLGLTPRPSALI